MSRARAGGRVSASENSLTQQLGKWVCSPAPQINRSCSLWSAAGSARGGRARRCKTSTWSATRPPQPSKKTSPDPPGRSTVGSAPLGPEYPPHCTHTWRGPRRCGLQTPLSFQAPPTLGRLWRYREWLVTVRCREGSLLWGLVGKGTKEEHPRRIKRESSALSLFDPECCVSSGPPPFKTTGALKISSWEGGRSRWPGPLKLESLLFL